jgi:hypothetical protein
VAVIPDATKGAEKKNKGFDCQFHDLDDSPKCETISFGLAKINFLRQDTVYTPHCHSLDIFIFVYYSPTLLSKPLFFSAPLVASGITATAPLCPYFPHTSK